MFDSGEEFDSGQASDWGRLGGLKTTGEVAEASPDDVMNASPESHERSWANAAFWRWLATESVGSFDDYDPFSGSESPITWH